MMAHLDGRQINGSIHLKALASPSAHGRLSERSPYVAMTNTARPFY